jgi:tRNA(Ile)-lysidine synthase
VESLVQRVAEALERAGVDGADPVGVACSGGADSATLAHVAMLLCRRGRLGPVTLIHVDHGLRSGSAAEGALVARLAASGGAEVVRVRASVNRGRASLEEAARDARYAALDRVADERELAAVLVAHTASDQAETVLLRLVRGTGVAGLAAMALRRGRYVRPLLEVTRTEIDEYIHTLELEVVTDPMNMDPAFARSRVRHRLLPLLRAENPAIDAALVRLASSAGQQREILDWAADALLARARGEATEAEAAPLSIAALLAAPAPVRRHALARAVTEAGGGPLSARHLRALDDLLGRPEAGSASIDLPGLRAVREYDRLRLAPAAGAPGLPRPEALVRGPDGPYQVRPWRPGDRMRPARLGGRSRKLSDLYTDARVPRSRRSHAIVVARAADGAIVWAQYIGPAHGARIDVSLTTPGRVASNKG